MQLKKIMGCLAVCLLAVFFSSAAFAYKDVIVSYSCPHDFNLVSVDENVSYSHKHCPGAVHMKKMDNGDPNWNIKVREKCSYDVTGTFDNTCEIHSLDKDHATVLIADKDGRCTCKVLS